MTGIMNEKYKAAPGVVYTAVCGHAYLVTPEDILEINETSAFFWQYLGTGITVKELAEKAAASYAIGDASALLADIRYFVDALLSRHMLVRYTA